MFKIDELEVDDVKEMSDEEVAVLFSVIQQQEQYKKMRQAVLSYLDVRDANENPRTIRIDSKVIN